VLIECQGHNISHYQDIEIHQIVRLHWSVLSSIQHPLSERKLTRITLSFEKIDICCCRQGRHPDEDSSTDHPSRSQHVVRREPVVDDHKDSSPPSRTCLHHIHICITGRLQETDLPVSFDHFLSLSLSLSSMHIAKYGEGERRVELKLASAYSTALILTTAKIMVDY
jgi:hypothetical protein